MTHNGGLYSGNTRCASNYNLDVRDCNSNELRGKEQSSVSNRSQRASVYIQYCHKYIRSICRRSVILFHK